MITFTLILALFYPRLALMIGYAGNGILPNPFPFGVDFLLGAFIPRLLFVIYIAVNFETLEHSMMWLILHLFSIFFHAITNSNSE